MSDLLINEKTKQELANFLASPSHALLISGLDGSGRLALAKSLASDLLAATGLEISATFRLVESDEKGKISIEQIRELKQFTMLKPGSSRVILIADADRMGNPAQNSFLKLLEEPPENTTIILTALASKLKRTIISRVQQISVRSVSLEAANEYFDFSEDQISQAYKVSGGRLGLLAQLLTFSEHPLNLAVQDAKKILASDSYQRLCQVDQLAKDKIKALAVLAMLGQMASAALVYASEVASIKRWEKVLAASYQAETALASQANAKLVLTNLMLQL